VASAIFFADTDDGPWTRHRKINRVGLSIVVLQQVFKPPSEIIAIIDKPWRTELRGGLRSNVVFYGD